MAAFEGEAPLSIKPFDHTSFIDLRQARLPSHDHSNDYEPRDHRAPSQPITVSMAYFNILRAGFGAGMLGAPLAISQVGYICGPIMSFCVGLLIMYTHINLMWSLNEISRQLQIPHISYRYGFRLALLRGPPCCHGLGHIGPTIVALFMIMSQLGICTIFVILTADSIRDVLDFPSSSPAMQLLLVPFLILELSMKNLKWVSYVSMAGNALNVLGLILVLYLFTLHPPPEKLYMFPRIFRGFQFALGNLLFISSALGVTLMLDRSLKNPRVLTKKWGVLMVCIPIINIATIIFGTMGYIYHGVMDDNIMRYLPLDNVITMTVNWLYSISTAFAYPINCYPATQMILEVIRNHDPRNRPSAVTLKVMQYIARPFFVCCTFFIAYCVPFQSALVAFVGSSCTTIISIVFPTLMDLCIRYPDYNYGRLNFHLLKDFVIIISGLTCWVIGTITCGLILKARVLSLPSPSEVEFI